VECLFPVESPAIRRVIIDSMLPVHLGDNVQCCEMDAGGNYIRLKPGKADRLDSQRWMMESQG
jgi:polyphosphate kinase